MVGLSVAWLQYMASQPMKDWEAYVEQFRAVAHAMLRQYLAGAQACTWVIARYDAAWAHGFCSDDSAIEQMLERPCGATMLPPAGLSELGRVGYPHGRLIGQSVDEQWDSAQWHALERVGRGCARRQSVSARTKTRRALRR
ncbi:hypothetical protein WK99_10380 [Burkholderia ubonensis]|nr:hypothetical protein WK99_10380 [Burkholderia ubonensis]